MFIGVFSNFPTVNWDWNQEQARKHASAMAKVRQTPAPLTGKQLALLLKNRARMARSNASLPRGDLAGTGRRAVLVSMPLAMSTKRKNPVAARIMREKALIKKILHLRKAIAAANEYGDEEDVSVNEFPIADPADTHNEPMAN